MHRRGLGRARIAGEGYELVLLAIAAMLIIRSGGRMDCPWIGGVPPLLVISPPKNRFQYGKLAYSTSHFLA